MFGNIYVHQLRICLFLQGIWLIGNVVMVSRANYTEKYSQKNVSLKYYKITDWWFQT